MKYFFNGVWILSAIAVVVAIVRLDGWLLRIVVAVAGVLFLILLRAIIILLRKSNLL